MSCILAGCFPPFEKHLIILEKVFFYCFISEEIFFSSLVNIFVCYAFLMSSALLQNVCFFRLLTLIGHSIKFVMLQSVAMKKKLLYHLRRITHSKNSQNEKTCQENYINQDT